MSPLSLTRRTLTRRAFTTGAAAAAVATVAGCTGGDESPDNGEQAPDQVTYLTAFGASPHDAFVFVADEKGYFAEAGIEAQIQVAGGTGNYTDLLSGAAHFTYSDLAGMFIDFGRGELQGGDFRALASVHQRTLVAIIAPADSGIAAPADLEGKKIGAFTGAVTQTLLPAYAELSGWEFDPDQIENASPQDLFGLLATGSVDAISTFGIQRGVVENIIQKETVMFPFDQYLSDLLGTGLVCTSQLADENPDLVTRFRDAALRGLRDALADPQAAIDVLAARVPDAVPENLAPLVGQIAAMTGYVTADGEDRIGMIDEAHVVRCIHVLQGASLIPAGFTPDMLIGQGTLLTSS